MLAILLAGPVLAGPVASLRPTDEAFHRAFDAAADRTRVVALLSPTCRTCRRGATALADLLAAHPDVAAFVVWEPVLGKDRRPDRRQRREMPARATLFWDPDRSLSDAIVAAARDAGADDAVPEDGIVWDVVFRYEPGRTWPSDGTFPLPDWWGAPVVNAVEPLRGELAPEAASDGPAPR